MTVNTYVIASSKSWNRSVFELIEGGSSARWLWVTSPEELIQCVKQHTSLRYLFFLHWNWLVPTEIWSLYECVCFHMTDVPYGRGGSPLQNLIKAGHKETQLTALRMVEDMDAGPVYTKQPLSLFGRAEEIYIRAGELSTEIIRWMIEVEPTPSEQVGEVTTFSRRSPEQSELPEGGDLDSLNDHIRMLDAPGYPLAFIEHGDFRLEFSHSQVSGDELNARVVMRRLSDKDKG